MFDVIWKNKEWLFSGVGVVVVLWILGALRYAYNFVRHGVSQPARLLHAIRRLKFWGISWDFTGYFLGMSVVNGDNIHVEVLQIQGHNHSSSPFMKVSGYIQSNMTNARIPILLDSMPPEETNGIPPKCKFWVKALFRDPAAVREGVEVNKFLREFGDFTFFFQYDNYTYRYRFKTSEVQALISLFRAQSNPQPPPMITRRDK